MRNGRKISLLATLILVVASLAGLCYLLSPSPTPESAIRKYVFLKGASPIEAFDLQIKRGEYVDPQYGQQFFVEGFHAPGTEMQVCFFYLKKTAAGWYVVSAGTGP